MSTAPAARPFLFEISTEVCNQVGGIYTVLRTKAPSMLSRWNSNYFLLGPYNEESAAIEFEEGEIHPVVQSALMKLQAMGVQCYAGRWLIDGRPQVILFDYSHRFPTLHEDKYFLWADHGLSLPENDLEINNAVAFGATLVQFFQALTAEPDCPKVVAHFHEWLAGVAIPRLRHLQVPVGTVFTTHATLLGRYMAGDNPNFYDSLESIEPFSAARRYNIEPRFMIERVATHSAHVFTTISQVTARETERLLGRTPDVIVPNGISLERFTALHEFQILHLKYKERIHQFVMGHFFSSYSFDLDRTLYVLISGRYEYRNKGMDIFIEALYRLNQRLKEIFDPPTIVAFIVTKGDVKSVNVGALQGQSMLDDLRNVCGELESGITKRILPVVASGKMPSYEDLLPAEFQVRFKRAMHARKAHRLPPIVTHDLYNDATDPVLEHLRHRHLFNEPTDPVKVVFHPQFLSATNPLINLDYDQFVRGCHLGVFPSHYEPWGYTPLECLALGIPTVTTDLTGFGNFALNKLEERNQESLADQGLHVLRRAGRGTDALIEELTDYLIRFVQLSQRERIEIRNRAERLSSAFDWGKLSAYYAEAHDKAVKAI